MSQANQRQEGGDHYKQDGNPQHWDLAVMYQWDPFQYQITKYVMRWKDKFDTPEKRLVDLKKARHFLDKYIEEASKYERPVVVLPPYENLTALSDSNEFWQNEGFYGDMTQLYKCRHCGLYLKAKDRSHASEIHAQPCTEAKA